MICPNCGENNSANFRYCGMCGTSLEPRRPAGAPRTVSASEMGRPMQSAQSVATEPRTQARTGVSEVHSTPPSAGPSFLGLNQPFTEGDGSDSKASASTDQSFSGLDSFFEQDEPGVSARGIIFLLVLLAALGAGGWWAYTHYNGAKPIQGTTSQTASPAPATQPNNALETATSNSTSNRKAPDASASPNANSLPNPTASQPAAASPAESANSTPPPAVEPKSDRNPPVPPQPAERNVARNRASDRSSRTQKVARAANKPAARPSPAPLTSGNKGDAEFKRGEAYLYGRGVPENCDQAIKNLKAASAMQNAKARSTFGTMYATGHCVARDLPTSYSWFAQALHADPNNSILEKDLTAVWNQMTPPERQMAAKAKP